MLRDEFEEYEYVLLGDKGDASLYDFNSFGLKVHNYVGKTSIQELITLISDAEFIICHDSSVMHLSSILDKAVLAIYGPTDFERTFPNTKKSMFIKQDLDCIHCMKDYRLNEKTALKNCPIDNACMRLLEPKLIFEKIRKESIL